MGEKRESQGTQERDVWKEWNTERGEKGETVGRSSEGPRGEKD